MNAKLEEAEILAKAGVGAFMAAEHDGTTAQLDPDDVHQMADAMASVPYVTAEALGNSPMLGFLQSPVGLRDNILSTYYDRVFAQDFENAEVEREDFFQRSEDIRREAVYANSRLSPDEIGRLEWDAENGDPSALIRMNEQFYLG